MTDRALQNAIQMANLQPPNKAAMEVLSQMGVQHDPSKLALLELLEAKVQDEGRDPPDNVADDLYGLKEGLTADWVRKMTAHLVEEETDAANLSRANAQTLMDWLTDAIPLDEFSPNWLATVTRD